MFGKILVPVDGSDYSLRAVEAAVSLAEKFDSMVTVMYVASMPLNNAGFAESFAVIPDNVMEGIEKEGEEVLKRAMSTFKGRKVRALVRTGHPAGEILNEAKKYGYDLIILGSRGLGEIRGFVMGSVSDRVTHHAECAVLVVH